MNYLLFVVWIASIAWLTRATPEDSEQTQFIKRIARHFTTAFFIAAIVMAGFVLLCEKTEPKATPEAQADTVFDRGARYD